MKKKKIVLRSEAIKAGAQVYFTGKSCKQGHITQRYVTSCTCIECARLSKIAERAAIKAGRKQVAA